VRLLDGEGALCLMRQTRPTARRGYIYAPVLVITSTTLLLLNRVREIIGYGTVGKRQWVRWGKRPVYQYVTTSKGILYILPLLHLTVKERQCQLLLEAARLLSGHSHNQYTDLSYYDRLDDIRAEITSLSQKGRRELARPKFVKNGLPLECDGPRDETGKFVEKRA